MKQERGRMPNDADQVGCEEALRRLAAFLDGELPAAEATEVEQHLDTCRSCFSRADFERRLQERIRRDLLVTVIPEGAERRIRSLLQRLQETG